MKRLADEKAQAMQRVRVGMIGLAAIILLIGLASLVLSGARDGRADGAAAGSNAAVVATMASADDAPGNDSDEPLADLGVAPGSASVDNGQNR
jgi:hypothetical protein